MVTIPLTIPVIIYFILLVVVFIFFSVTFHHLIATGTYSIASFSMSFFVIAGLIFVLYSTGVAATEIDWNQNIVLFDGLDAYKPF